tara:strand:+ start:400 stop:4635 length:4236 start_codon:yes stop_codon:yes gene_type:complete
MSVFSKKTAEAAERAKKVWRGNTAEISGMPGNPDKVRLTKGGSPRDWQALPGEERDKIFREAGLNNQWLSVSFQTNEAFTEVIEKTQTLVNGYKSAMEAGKTLMYANRALALATLNPAALALEQLIELAKSTIDDIMGAGMYWILIDSQQLNEKDHGVKPRDYNLEFSRFNLSGLTIDPFTNTMFFHIQPIMDINVLRAKSRQWDDNLSKYPGIGIANPYRGQVWEYANQPSKYLIYNGKIYNKLTKEPVYVGGNTVYNMPSKLLRNAMSTLLFGKLDRNICTPKKMIEVMNASFDDKDDPKRPLFSDNARIGGLVIIAGVTDPTKMAEKIVKLYNYFSGFGPLARAANIALNALNSSYKYRTETIIVENLCAPNNFNNPPPDEWPLTAGEDANLLRSRDVWRLGHNSDNVDRYGGGITKYNKDKVLLKNLRTKEVMQVISVGPAKKIDVPSAAGQDKVMDSDGRAIRASQGTVDYSEAENTEMMVGPETGLANEQGIDIFNSRSQKTKIRYRQEIIVQHNDIKIDTEPGDVLIEVEVSGFRNLNKDTGETQAQPWWETPVDNDAVGTSPEDSAEIIEATSETQDPSYLQASDGFGGAAGGGSGISTENDWKDYWNNFGRVPIFTLKNGTPLQDDKDVEKVFNMIMLDRSIAAGDMEEKQLIEAHLHYSNKINSDEETYRRDLTYFLEVSEDEARDYFSSLSTGTLGMDAIAEIKDESGFPIIDLPKNQEEATLWMDINSMDQIIERQESQLRDLSGGSSGPNVDSEASKKSAVADIQGKIEQLNENISTNELKLEASKNNIISYESKLNSLNLILSEIQNVTSEGLYGDIRQKSAEVYYPSGDIQKRIADLKEENEGFKSQMVMHFEDAKEDYIGLRYYVHINEILTENRRNLISVELNQESMGLLPEPTNEQIAEAQQKAEDDWNESVGYSTQTGLPEYFPQHPGAVYDNLHIKLVSGIEQVKKLEAGFQQELETQVFNSSTDNKLEEKLNNSLYEFSDGIIPIDSLSFDNKIELLNQRIENLEMDRFNEETNKITLENSLVSDKDRKNNLIIDKHTILSYMESDDIETSLEAIKLRRKRKFETLQGLISTRPQSEENLGIFVIEKVARGRWEKIKMDRLSAIANAINYDLDNDTMSDYGVVMSSEDLLAKQKWETLLYSLVAQDPDEILDIDHTQWQLQDLKLTKTESLKAIKLIQDFSAVDFPTGTLSADMKNFFENMLDEHLYFPYYKNSSSGTILPAPKYMSVVNTENIELDKPKVTNDLKGTYPDWESVTLERIIPGFRDALNLIVTLLQKSKDLIATTVSAIDDIIRFIEDEIIPQLEEIIAMIQEFIDILKIGIIDAGIYFLHIPVGSGGTNRFRKELVNGKNPPPENIDFTYGIMAFQGSAGEESSKSSAMEILEPFLGVS